MSLGLIKALKSLTIKQKNEKLLLIKIFAVGIYADRVVKKEEIDKALDIFHQSFYDEIINHDWEFFRDKLEKKLKNYDAEPQLFLEDEEDIVNWIVKEKREDLAQVLFEIYKSDNNMDKKEERIISKLSNLIKDTE